MTLRSMYSLGRPRDCALLLALAAGLPSLAGAQAPEVARLPEVVRTLTGSTPDRGRTDVRTWATVPLNAERLAAVVGGGEPAAGGEWVPEIWGVFLVERHPPYRVWTLDTLLGVLPFAEHQPTIDYVGSGELLIRQTVDRGDMGPHVQCRQYFFAPTTGTLLGRRVYWQGGAHSPVTVGDTVFAVLGAPADRTNDGVPDTAAVLLSVPLDGGLPQVALYEGITGSRLEAAGDTLRLLADSAAYDRAPGQVTWRERVLPDSARMQSPPEHGRPLHAALPGFRIVRHGIAAIRGQDTALIPLPQPTLEQWRRARPEVAREHVADALEAAIGPVALVGDRAWFGITFYDGEGTSGVGGLGWFHPATRALRVLHPRALTDWSASALAAEDSTLWVGLAEYGEGPAVAGGLVRYDIRTGRLSRYDVPGLVTEIKAVRGTLYLAGELGLRVLRGRTLERLSVRFDRAGTPHLLRSRLLLRVSDRTRG